MARVVPDGDPAIYNFPNTFVPSISQPRTDFGMVAALRLFQDLPPKTYRPYFKPIGYPSIRGSYVDGIGNGEDVLRANTHGNFQFAYLLKQVGLAHYAILRSQRLPTFYSDTRISAANYNHTAFADHLDFLSLSDGSTAIQNLDRHFQTLGQSFGINPILVKSAFVAKLKKQFLNATGPAIVNDMVDGVHPQVLFESMDRLWGVTPINPPSTYYGQYGYLGTSGGGNGGGRGRRKKRTRKSRRYY